MLSKNSFARTILGASVLVLDDFDFITFDNSEAVKESGEDIILGRRVVCFLDRKFESGQTG
jgi:hypothetical protein